jgi:CBS domain-containing protein
MYNIAGAGLSDDNSVYSKLKVKDIMTKNPFYLTTNATIKDVSEVLVKGNYHAVPIVEEDKKIAGIVSTADVIKFLLTENNTTKII